MHKIINHGIQTFSVFITSLCIIECTIVKHDTYTISYNHAYFIYVKHASVFKATVIIMKIDNQESSYIKNIYSLIITSN